MGAAPARNDPPPRPLSVRCPQCKTEIAVTAAPPVTLPCPGCGKFVRVKQG